MFSYALYDLTNPELLAIYRRRLAVDSKNFCRWQAKARNRWADPNVRKLFKLWWRLDGPTAFRTHDDSEQYKNSLWQFVELEEPRERGIVYNDPNVVWSDGNHLTVAVT